MPFPEHEINLLFFMDIRFSLDGDDTDMNNRRHKKG